MHAYGNPSYRYPDPSISQLDPRHLTVFRSWRAPGVVGPCDLGERIVPGPGGSVWTGFASMLLQVDPATGATLSQIDLPLGAALSDLSTDPTDTYLYISFSPLVRGGTGTLGLTIHLSQQNLGPIAPPGPGIGLQGPGLFHWIMGAVPFFGAGVLWLSSDSGLLACLDPQTGTALATEQLPASAALLTPLAASSPPGVLFANGASGLVRITPPGRCWH